jgi:uncharacterized protein (DUF1330 family)
MPAYIVANFTVTNAKDYESYVPAVVPTLFAHGAEILAVDYGSEPLEGDPFKVTVILKFESRKAAQAWYRSAEYQDVIQLRTKNSDGVVVLADGFVRPS